MHFTGVLLPVILLQRLNKYTNLKFEENFTVVNQIVNKFVMQANVLFYPSLFSHKIDAKFKYTFPLSFAIKSAGERVRRPRRGWRGIQYELMSNDLFQKQKTNEVNTSTFIKIRLPVTVPRKKQKFFVRDSNPGRR